MKKLTFKILFSSLLILFLGFGLSSCDDLFDDIDGTWKATVATDADEINYQFTFSSDNKFTYRVWNTSNPDKFIRDTGGSYNTYEAGVIQLNFLDYGTKRYNYDLNKRTLTLYDFEGSPELVFSKIRANSQ